MRLPVVLTIRGAEGTPEKTFQGTLMEKEGVTYLFYQGESGPCRITVSSAEAMIRRNGEALSELRILPGKFTDAVLSQDFGSLTFRVKGRRISVRSFGESRVIELSYTLYQGDAPAAENLVRIDVRPAAENR